VVYRITRVNAGDSLSVDARKIVNGQEEEMGVLGCRVAKGGALFTCAIPNGVWRFTVRGDSLAGELRLPDNTKFRDVRTTRSPVNSRADDRASTTVRRQLLAALTPPLLSDVDSVRKLLAPGSLREAVWLVRAKNVGAKAEDRFRLAVLHASGGREFTNRDSSAMVVSVESMQLAGDSAAVFVDRSRRSCKDSGMIVGAVYVYRFVRGSAGWLFLDESPYTYWDPAPPPPPGAPNYGCTHLFAL
jgi:hypothetical protein